LVLSTEYPILHWTRGQRYFA